VLYIILYLYIQPKKKKTKKTNHIPPLLLRGWLRKGEDNAHVRNLQLHTCVRASIFLPCYAIRVTYLGREVFFFTPRIYTAQSVSQSVSQSDRQTDRQERRAGAQTDGAGEDHLIPFLSFAFLSFFFLLFFLSFFLSFSLPPSN
jgi:hypothetical protein